MPFDPDRRSFLALAGGAAVAWPRVARAQEPVRRLGVLMSLAAGDRESQVRLAAFLRALRDLSYDEGRNLRVDIRWGDDDAERTRGAAAELVALAPDAILASGNTAAKPLKLTTASVPIVFVQVAEPLGEHLVESFARPGGNVTGFASIEYGMSARWLGLLKELAPGVRRVVVIRDPATAAGTGQFGAIAAVAPSLSVELSAVGVRDAFAIERAMTALGGADGGLIVTTSTRAAFHRDLIVALAAKHRLPAVYPFRHYVAAGGLIAYGADWTDQYRRAAGYVGRILKGEKPGDLPVQTPQKYETIVNRKTAAALGFAIPAAVLARADEVID